MEVRFLELGSVNDELLRYAVILARSDGRWVFVRNRERSTWEVPGGRREPGEDITETARRELVEETGAVKFRLGPISVYCVIWNDSPSYGQLFYASIEELGELPDYEIVERALLESLPDNLTYPHIQGELFRHFLRVSREAADD
jgi:8-oxo-dGTP diphosphatase